MSTFRVNTNMMAMNALRNLGSTNSQFAGSVTRLSTGLRINSGADDPAGLQISEGFRAQISGLSQAMRNSQDATNFAKTAEGALDEVSRLLRDARALVLANGNEATLSADQKQANQNQLTSILNSVDRIASQTQFGNRRLLDGSAGVTTSILNRSAIESATIGGTLGTTAVNAPVNANGAISVQVTAAAIKAKVTGMAVANPAVAIGVDGVITINNVQFNVTAGMTHQNLIDQINARSADTGVQAAVTGGNLVFTATNFGTGSNSIQISNSTNNIGFALAGTRTLGSGTLGVDATVAFTYGSNPTFSLTASSTNGRTFRDSFGNVITLTEDYVDALQAATNLLQVSVGSAQFQIGANIGQTVNLSISNVGTSSLAISGLDITTSAGAASAMNALDNAIARVSTIRGDLGSFMRNILDSNQRSLAVAKENITATESSIRDTDVAEEMTAFTKLQILQQSGLAVLAQANQAPQAVLSLLRG